MSRRTTRLVRWLRYTSRTVLLPITITVAVAVTLSSFIRASEFTQLDAQAATGCLLSNVAFCDTFDNPSPNGAGTRSGDLDGVVWGVSRTTSDDSPGQGSYFHWNASTRDTCGTTVTVAQPRDVQICNGQLVESVSD